MIGGPSFSLDTYIPELPKLLQQKFDAIQSYLDVFYDGSTGLVVAPITTTGNVTGSKATYVTGVFDNLIVRNQFTNLYENTTSIDADYYNIYTDASGATVYVKRDASILGTLIENGDFSYVDLNQPYFRMTNDSSLAFQTDTLGQEFQLIWDPSTLYIGDNSPFVILLDPCVGDGTVQTLSVAKSDAATTWVKLIGVDYDSSWGMKYVVKQHAGTYTIATY